MSPKNQKLLDDFFTEKLSDEHKKQFIKKGASDPEFVRELVRRIEFEEAFEHLFNQSPL